MANLSADVRDLAVEIADVSREVTDLQREVRDLPRHLTDLSAEVRPLPSEIGDLSSHVSDLSREVAHPSREATRPLPRGHPTSPALTGSHSDLNEINTLESILAVRSTFFLPFRNSVSDPGRARTGAAPTEKNPPRWMHLRCATVRLGRRLERRREGRET